MAKKRKDLSEQRQHQILEAAEAVLLEVGIDRFTVDQVVSKAGIAKGTVYNYYKHKNQMLAQLGAKVLGLLHASFLEAAVEAPSYLDKIKSICHTHYLYSEKHPAYSDLIFYVEKLEADQSTQDYVKASHGITDYMVELIERGQAAGEIKEDIEPLMLTYVIWVTSAGIVEFLDLKKNLLRDRHQIQTKMMVDLFNKMLIEGIKN